MSFFARRINNLHARLQTLDRNRFLALGLRGMGNELVVRPNKAPDAPHRVRPRRRDLLGAVRRCARMTPATLQILFLTG
jgi:hypothetical protein